MSNIIITPIEEEVLTLYSQGVSKEDVALRLKLPLYEIRKIFNRPKIKDKIKEMIEYRSMMLRERHLNILEGITEQKLKEAEGDLTSLLGENRDILDIITVADKVTKDREKESLKVQQNNVFINVLEQLSSNIDDTEVVNDE